MPSTIVVARGLLSPMPWFSAAFYPPWGKGLMCFVFCILYYVKITGVTKFSILLGGDTTVHTLTLLSNA